jgi:mono/diheme cytochrome c family protein
MKLTGGIKSHILACCMIVAAVVTAAAGVASLNGDARPASAAPLAHAAVETPSSAEVAEHPAVSEWDKRWWIEKTARLLRAGEGLGPNDDIERLSKLPKTEIAREFMRDERFGDTVLDFNMFFLGFKIDSLKVDGTYVHSAFDFANAISSAKALVQDGDYLKLFDLEGEYYLAPLTMTPSEDKLEPEDAKLAPRQMREKAVGELKAELSTLLNLRTGPNPLGAHDFCEAVEELTDQQSAISQKLFRAFTDAEIFALMHGGIPEFIYETLEQVASEECEKPEDKVDVQRFTDSLTRLTAQLDRAFKEIGKFEPTAYEPDSVGDFKSVDRSAFPHKGDWIAFGFEQGTALANSSTNYNRKRAAYVLKRFFCDDLTPVGFENPAEHVSGAHGSQTSCYSCHYKLDPMAGFFRDRGALFADSSATSDIVFDDLASVDRKTYQSVWRAPQGAGREWDVGYIRSPRWTDQNSYGQSVADLSKIIRSAPEAKRCLMKRLTEYVVGENQTMDGAYLDRLTAVFEQDAAANSSAAFKNAMISLLESETYQTRNPDPQRCYDYAPGPKADDRPPCRVAYILQKNCVQCHSKQGDGFNTLDLSKWVAAPGGKGHVFPHLNSKNEQIAAQDTLLRMGSRISDTDLKKRMPKNKPMSSQERQELYLWLQSELARRSAE